MLAETKKLLVVNCSIQEYPAVKYIALSLEKRIRMGDKNLEQKMIKSGKPVGECWKYVLNRARKEHCYGAQDSEVMSWVIHFYDENGNPSDMTISDKSVPVYDAEKIKKEKEAAIRRQREQRDLIDLAMMETGYKKDKIMTKFVTFYLNVCDDCKRKQVRSPSQNALLEWVRKSVYQKDCIAAIGELGVPDDIVKKHIDIVKDIKIREKDRKELIVNDMPTLF